MSTSNENQPRANEEKLNPRERQLLEEKAKNRRSRTKYIIIGVVIVLLIAVVFFVTSNLFTNGLTALTVGDTRYTVADVNYYYRSAYMSFYNNYSSYISYFLDTSKPLDEQTCSISDTEQTWADYFRATAVKNMQQITAYYDAAVAAGYTLSADEQSTIDSTIENYKPYADAYGYSLDGYLANYYGPGNNEKTVRRNMEKQQLASDYLSAIYDGFTYTDDQLDTYYSDNRDDFDKVKFTYAYIAGKADEANGIDADTAMATAGDQATQILDTWNNGDADAFKAAIQSVTGSEASETSVTRNSFFSQFEGSVTADTLKEGMTFTHQSTSGWYAVYVEGFDDNNYHTVSVRHILVKAVDTDGDGTYSDVEKQVAYDAVKAIEDEWLAGDATEDSFAALANLKSEDTGSNTNGGLYEGIYKGETVAEFDAFCFADHKYGDYAIVYGETSDYTGYHLVYFVNADGELYTRVLAENAMRSKDYSAWCDTAIAPYAVEASDYKFMYRYVMS